MTGGEVAYEVPELRGNTLRFDNETVAWTFDLKTPETKWRWQETPVVPAFLKGASGY